MDEMDDVIPGGAAPGQDGGDLDFDGLDAIELRVEDLKAAEVASADDGEVDLDREVDEFLAEMKADDPALAYAERVADKVYVASLLREIDAREEAETLADAAMAAVAEEDMDGAEFDRRLAELEAEQAAFFQELGELRDLALDPVHGEATRARLRAMCAEHGILFSDPDSDDAE